jgi:hypothetical protein
MDSLAIATIASTTISLIAPYLKTIGEVIVDKASGEIGSKVGSAAWGKVKNIYDMVKLKFKASPDTEKAINALEAKPDDDEIQAVVRFHLKEILKVDNEFAKELANLLRESSVACADTIFNTTVMGNVQKLIQMGYVYGDVNIE